MKTKLQFDEVARTSAQICAAVAFAIGMHTYLAWHLGYWRPVAFGANYVPVASSTSLLFMLLSGAVLLRSRWPAKPHVKAFAVLAAGVVALFSVLVGASHLFGLEWTWESWLAPTVETKHDIPLNRMALPTALTFLLAAAAILLELSPFGRRRRLQYLGAALAVAVTMVGLVVALGYALGAMELQGVASIPMALFTALAFILLGAGLLLESGPVRSRLESLTRNTLPSTDRPLSAFPRFLVILLVVLTTAIGASGFFIIKRQLAEARREVEDDLVTIADLKVGQIARWRQERLADARTVLDSCDIADDWQVLLADPANARARKRVLDVMAALKAHNYYARVLLLDTDQKVRFSVPTDEGWLGPIAKSFAARALRGKRVLVSDLHISPVKPGYVNMDLFVPLMPSPEENAAAPKPVGVLMFEIDPTEYLFPLVQSWPTPRLTAETLLVRRDGDDVLYLNELRHRADTALRLRLPISRLDLPAAMAVLGHEKVLAGVDYRGVPVMAVFRSIPDSPWFMVAKIDQEEVYAPIRQQLLVNAALFGAMLLTAVLGVGLLWRQRDTAFLRHALAQEQQREALASRIAYLTKHANDIILLADHEWRILDANDRAIETYGYPLAELQQMTIRDLRSQEARDAFDRQTRSEDAMKGTVFETTHRRRDGSLFPVENSLRAIDVAGTTYYQFIIRDITERKHAEQDRLAHLHFLEGLDRVNHAIQGTNDLKQMMGGVLDALLATFGCDRAFLAYPCDPAAGSWRPVMERSRPEYAGQGGPESEYPVDEATGNHFAALRASHEPLAFAGSDFPLSAHWGERHQIQSMIATAVHPQGDRPYLLALHQCSHCRQWTPDDSQLLQEIAGRLSDALTSRLAYHSIEESEAKYRRIVNTANEGIWMLTPDDVTTFVNARMAEMLGYRCDEVIGRPFTSFMFEEDRADHSQKMKERRMGEPGHYERRLRHKDGHTVWVLISGTGIFDDQQQFAGSFGMFADITERKRAEEALQQERAFARAVFDSVPGMIYVYDEDGNPVRWNKRIEDVTGYSDEELACKNAITWFRGDEVGHIAAMIDHVFAEGYAATEATIVTKDGGRVPFYLTGVRLTFDDKRYLAGIGIDIADRKRAERALAQSESRLNAILSGLPVPCFVIDANHRVTHWNRAVERYSGLKAEEIIGTNQHWRAFYDHQRPCMADLQVDGLEDQIPELYAGKCVPSTLVEDAYVVTDFFPQMGENGIWLWFTCAPIRDADGRVVAAIETLVDVTGRKRAEEELRQSEERYELERRYHAVLDQSFEFISVLTPDGTVVEANRMALDIAGVNLPDVVGKPLWEMPWWIPSPDLEERLRSAVRAAAKGEVVRFDVAHQATGGVIHYDDGSLKPVRNERGEVVLLVSEARDVTEIKQAERRLRKSEYRYRTLYESSRDAIMILTPEKGFLAGNPATLAMFECKDEQEFTRYTPVDLSPERQPDGSLSSAKAQEMMAIAMREGSQVFEWTHKRVGGDEFPATVLLTRMNLEDEVVVQATVRDITKEKRLEEGRHEFESRFRDIVDNSGAGVVFVDSRNATIVSGNQAMAAMLGRSQEELHGMSIFAMHPADDAVHTAQRFQEHRFGTRHTSPSVPMLRKDGTRFYADVTSIGMTLNGVPCLGVFFYDATERTHAEETLRNSERRYRTLFESAAEGLIIADAETRQFRHANAAMCRMLGYSEDELTQMSVSDIHPKDALERVSAMFQLMAEQKVSSWQVVPCLRKDGTIIYTNTSASDIVIDGRSHLVGFFTDVTDRIRAEEALRQSEKQLRDILDGTGPNIFIGLLTPEGIFIETNRPSLECAGLRREEVIGRPIEEVGAWSYSDASRQQIREIVQRTARGEPSRCDMDIRAAGDQCIALDVSMHPLRNEAGAVVSLVLAANVITERKRAGEEIRKSQRRLRSLIDGVSPNMFIGLLTPDGTLLETNRPALEVANLKLEDVQGTPFEENYWWSYSDDVRRQLRAAIDRAARGEPSRYDVTVRVAENQFAVLDFCLQPLRDETGEIVFLVPSANVITERKQAEEALRKSELLYRTLFQSANDAVFLMDGKSFLDCNSVATRLLGRSREQLLSHSPAVFSPPIQADGRDSGESAAEKTFAAMAGRPQFFEWTHQRADGDFVLVEVSLSRVEGIDEPMILAITRDITDRKRAEAELARYREHLEELVRERTAQLAAKNEELKGFAYTVSHDLKAPLRGIAGYANELERKHRAGLPDRAQFCVNQILTATHNLDNLIEDLLHYSRLDTETPTDTDVNLHGMIEAILRDRSPIIAEQHTEVTVDVPAGTLQTWERGLAEVLTNLIDNALKYSRKAEPPRVTIRAEELQTCWHIIVADNGIGFDMKYHDRIFGLFNRLVREDEFEGTGAGLAIVKKMVDKQGGRVWAESAPNQGATFFVEIPKSRQPELPPTLLWQGASLAMTLTPQT
jgi:PAS domain S-box-containing protein